MAAPRPAPPSYTPCECCTGSALDGGSGSAGLQLLRLRVARLAACRPLPLSPAPSPPLHTQRPRGARPLQQPHRWRALSVRAAPLCGQPLGPPLQCAPARLGKPAALRRLVCVWGGGPPGQLQGMQEWLSSGAGRHRVGCMTCRARSQPAAASNQGCRRRCPPAGRRMKHAGGRAKVTSTQSTGRPLPGTTTTCARGARGGTTCAVGGPGGPRVPWWGGLGEGGGKGRGLRCACRSGGGSRSGVSALFGGESIAHASPSCCTHGARMQALHITADNAYHGGGRGAAAGGGASELPRCWEAQGIWAWWL
jgi:hypothetical protein